MGDDGAFDRGVITGGEEGDDSFAPPAGVGVELAHTVDVGAEHVGHEPPELGSGLGDYADVIVVDSPPLTEVADALPLADVVDTVLVAVRLGRSRRDKLDELRRALAQRGVSPAGFVVTTRRRAKRKTYGYSYQNVDRRRPALDDVVEPPVEIAPGRGE